jgi:hypothetical protein
MDLIAMLLVAGFFALSWGLTRFCERLQDERTSK